MKIVILRGGAAPARHRSNATAAASGTRHRGVAAIGDGSGQWLLLNMSPGVAHQLESDGRLARHPGLADGRSRSVLLTDAQIDHVGGLLSLREGAPIDLYATPAVFESLTTGMPVLPLLQHYCGVHWHVVPVAGDQLEAGFPVGSMAGLQFTALATRAESWPHLDRSAPGMVGDSIALAVHDRATGQRAVFAPGLVDLDDSAADWMREADCLLLDGPDHPSADAPPADWLSRLTALPARHKVLFGAASAAAALSGLPEMAAAGIALAYDGMAIEL